MVKKTEVKETKKLKLKHIKISNAANVEINRMNQKFNSYIEGVAAGIGIKGKWSFDVQSMCFIVEDDKADE